SEVGRGVLEQPQRRGAARRVPGAGVLHAAYPAAASAFHRRGARGGDRPAHGRPLVAPAAARGKRSPDRRRPRPVRSHSAIYSESVEAKRGTRPKGWFTTSRTTETEAGI